MTQNPYETGSQKNIPAVLVYIKYQGSILMLHRNKNSGDVHLGKWNGLGGKREVGESVLDTAIREVCEESGLTLAPSQFKVIGHLDFPNFKPSRSEDWSVTVFTAKLDASQYLQHSLTSLPKYNSPEGELSWVRECDILSLPLWEGDVIFIPYVLREEPFSGTFFYKNGNLLRSQIQGCFT